MESRVTIVVIHQYVVLCTKNHNNRSNNSIIKSFLKIYYKYLPSQNKPAQPSVQPFKHVPSFPHVEFKHVVLHAAKHLSP